MKRTLYRIFTPSHAWVEQRQNTWWNDIVRARYKARQEGRTLSRFGEVCAIVAGRLEALVRRR